MESKFRDFKAPFINAEDGGIDVMKTLLACVKTGNVELIEKAFHSLKITSFDYPTFVGLGLNIDPRNFVRLKLEILSALSEIGDIPQETFLNIVGQSLSESGNSNSYLTDFIIKMSVKNGNTNLFNAVRAHVENKGFDFKKMINIYSRDPQNLVYNIAISAAMSRNNEILMLLLMQAVDCVANQQCCLIRFLL